jgi:hypothetical protein
MKQTSNRKPFMVVENETEKTVERKLKTKAKTVVLLLAIASFTLAFSSASLANNALTASVQKTNALKSGLLITNKSVGPVRLGMTVSEARKALSGFTLHRTSDGEGLALIAVRRGKQTVMTFYAGEENPKARINEKAKIEFIEVWDASYKTAGGVHPKMQLSEVEKKYGKFTEITMSEIEAREYASFANMPKGITLRAIGQSGMAGIYPDNDRRATRYDPSAYLFSISINGLPNETTQFSSAYTDLATQCKNPAPDSNEGQHVSHFCKGYGGYFIHIFDTATTLQINLESSDRSVSIPLASQSLAYVQRGRKIEWRMANGKPFAVIVRVFKYKDGGEFPFQGKPIGEVLLVKGLPGYEQIDNEVDARANANANEKARELADGGYVGQNAQPTKDKGESTQSLVKKFIPQGMQLAHKAIEGAFGPSSKNVVALFEEEKPTRSYKGLVLVPDKDGYKKFALPEPRFTWSIEEPKAVFFANADKDPEQELFIIAECYTGIGPTGAQPFNRTRVYDWNESGFVHLESVSEKIGTASTVAEARKKLRLVR